MEPFTTLTATAAPMPIMNVDTDMIIPKQFLRTIKRTGLGVNLFNDMRYDETGHEIPNFVLNKEPYRNAEILVAGGNFGCGSSREHAPWALLDFGIRCVIAPSFADIFFNNCFKNGMLPIVLEQENIDMIMKEAETQNQVSIDLAAQKIALADGTEIGFDIDPFRKYCLLNGLDDIGLTLEKEASINAYEEKRANEKPWL